MKLYINKTLNIALCQKIHHLEREKPSDSIHTRTLDILSCIYKITNRLFLILNEEINTMIVNLKNNNNK